jgi:hypothetical protein
LTLHLQQSTKKQEKGPLKKEINKQQTMNDKQQITLNKLICSCKTKQKKTKEKRKLQY